MGEKKLLLTFLLFACVFIFSTYVRAVDEVTTEPTEAVSTKKSLSEERKNSSADKMEEKKESLKEKLEMKRKEASESMKLKLETFRENLAKIKDEKKQQLLEKIQDKLTAINKRRTDHMLSVLEKLNNILARLEEKVLKAKSNGIDTSSADKAVANAKTKIAQAETAVANQAGKSYIVSVVTETTLRSTVGQTVSQLQTDLRAVHKLVVDAKQSVMKVIPEVAKLKTGGLEVGQVDSLTPTVGATATPTATLTVTATP